MDKFNELATEKVTKLLIKFSIPAMVGSLVFALYNIIDRMFIGKGLGAYAMTGLALTFPIFTIYLSLGMLVGQGGGGILSIKLGQKKYDEAEKVLGNSFMLFVVFGIFFIIMGNLFMDKILVIFGATKNTIGYARSYIMIINNFVVFDFLSMGMNSLMRSEGSAKKAMKYIISGSILNIIGDYIFIFKFNFGIEGAAYSTALSTMIVSLLIVHHFTLNKNKKLSLRWKYLKLDPKIVKEILSIGVSPFTLMLATSMVGALSNNVLVNYGGDLAVGAMGAINSVSSFAMMIVVGLRAGSQPIIGYNFGAKNYDRVLETLKIAIMISIGVALFFQIIIMAVPGVFINLFNDGNQEMLKIGKSGIRIFMSLYIANAFYIVGTSFFQAIKETKKAMIVNIVKQVGALLPLLYILPKFMGITGVWLVYPITDLIGGLLTAYFIYHKVKEMKKVASEAKLEEENSKEDKLEKIESK